MEADLIPPTPSGSNYSAARTFARVGWPKVWAALYLYARGRLGLAEIGAKRARVIEAADLVNTLLLLSLEGTLGWALPGDATDGEILRLACLKLHGMRWTLHRQGARIVYHDDHHDGALDERPDPGPDAPARLMEARGLADLEGALAHDADASVYLREMLEGDARPDIMRTLGWPLKRADAAYKRITRRVAALCRRANEEGSRGRQPAGQGGRGGAP